MSTRFLIFVLACASAFSLSIAPGGARAAEVASGEDVEASEADEGLNEKTLKEIANCYRDADGVKFSEDSKEQLDCQVGILGSMQSDESSKAEDYYDKYFKTYLTEQLDSDDGAEHIRAKKLIRKLQNAIEGLEFDYIEASLKVLGTKAEYLEKKGKLLEQRMAVDVLNDKDAEAKLAEINRKEVLLDGQYNGVVTEQGLAVTKDPDAVGGDAQADSVMQQLNANLEAAQKMWEAYNGGGSNFERGGQVLSGSDVNTKSTPLIGADGLGLHTAPAMPDPGQGFGATVPGFDSSVN